MLKDLSMAKGAGSAVRPAGQGNSAGQRNLRKGAKRVYPRGKAGCAGGHSLPPSSAEMGRLEVKMLGKKGCGHKEVYVWNTL